MSNRIRALWASTFAVALAACAHHTASVAPRQDIVGHWIIDKPAAERSMRKPKFAAGSMQATIDGRQPVQRVWDTWMLRNEEIRLLVNGDKVTLVFADSATLHFSTDGEKQPQRFRDVPQVISTAHWSNGVLESEHDIGNIRILESYNRNAAGKLIVRTRIFSQMRPVSLTRVYRTASPY